MTSAPLYRSAPLWLAVACTVWAGGRASATDYYFNAGGSDSGNGTAASPWASLSMLGTVSVGNGDHIYLHGGDTFNGNITLASSTLQNFSSGLSITSYGTGRAAISTSTANSAISVYNIGGVSISNLNLLGSTAAADGINAFTDVANGRVSSLTLSNVTASNFTNGVEIGSDDARYAYGDTHATQGFNSLSVSGLTVFNNRADGLYVWGQNNHSNLNVNISHTTAYNNGANGIRLSATYGGDIERSVAHDNGLTTAGNVGIIVFDSDAVLVQHNEAYSNKSTGPNDGDGIDLDGGVTNCLVQYNYVHDNDGAGLQVGEYLGATPTTGNVVRFNVSQNDAQKNRHGGIYLYNFHPTTSVVSGNSIYNNTVYNATGQSALGLSGDLSSATGNNANVVANNILMTGGNDAAVVDDTMVGEKGVRLLNNDYFASGTFKLVAGGATYSSVAAWLNAVTSQERLDTNHDGVIDDNDGRIALAIDPQLTTPGGGSTIADPDALASLQAYLLLTQSQMKAAGLNLSTTLGLTVDGTDYYGIPLSSADAQPVGASVPEPGMLSLLGLGVGLMTRRQRRAV